MEQPDLNVRYIAQLARIELTDEEVATFQSQLTQVLAHVNNLRQVDVTGIEPTAHTSTIFNVFREDKPRDWFSQEAALANAPRQANGLFVVTKVLE